MVAELVPDLDHDLHRGATHGTDREGGEQERDRATQEEPASTSGWSILIGNSWPARFIASRTASANEPNSDVAARTAVAIAIPFVIALVELPTASSPPRMLRGPASNSPDISAIRLGVIRTGPYVSIDTIAPTVVSIPMPVREMKYSRSASESPR